MTQGLIQIHMAVFLFGFAGLFGKFLDCNPIYIVFGRTLFAFTALFFYEKLILKTTLLQSFKKSALLFVLQGVLLAIHWWSFFLAIQISTVAIALVTFSTFPLFVTFLEPLFFKEKLAVKNIALACMVFIGIIFVIPEYNFANDITKGALFGIFSGFTFALLAIINRKNRKTINSTTISFYQNLFASIFLIIPVLMLPAPLPEINDLPNIIFLGVVCTAIAHTLFINSLLFIRAQTASVITCLEPVYGIILAFLILNEIPGTRTIAGGLIIIASTIVVSLQTRKR